MIVMVRTADQMLWGGPTKDDEIGRACDMYGGKERHIQGFDGETGGKETTLTL